MPLTPEQQARLRELEAKIVTSSPATVKPEPRKKSELPSQIGTALAGPIGGMAVSAAQDIPSLSAQNVLGGLAQIGNTATFGLQKYQLGLLDKLSGALGGPTGIVTPEAIQRLITQSQTETPGINAVAQTVGSVLNPINLLTGGKPVVNTLANVVQGQVDVAPGESRLQRGLMDVLGNLAGVGVSRMGMPDAPSTVYRSDLQTTDTGGAVVNAQKELQNLTGKDLPVALDSLTSNKTLDVAANLTRKTPLVHQGFDRVGKEGAEQLGQILDEILPGKPIQRVGAAGAPERVLPPMVDAEQTVRAIDKGLLQYDKNTEGMVGPLYNQVNKSVGQFDIPTGFKNSVSEINDEINRSLLPNLDEGPGRRAVAELMASIEQSKKTSVAELFNTRKAINSALDSPSITPESRRILMKLKTGLDSAFSELEQTMPDVAALRQANQIFAAREQAKPQALLSKLESYLPSEQTGESASVGLQKLNQLARQNNGGELKKLFDIIGPENAQPFRDRFMQEIFRDKAGNYNILQGSPGSPSSFEFIRRQAQYNDKTLDLLVGERNRRIIRGLAALVPHMDDAIRNAQMGKASWAGLGPVAASSVSYPVAKATGAGIQAAAALAVASGGTYMLGAKLIDHMLTDPKNVERLLKVSQTTTGSRATKAIATTIVRELLQQETTNKVIQE